MIMTLTCYYRGPRWRLCHRETDLSNSRIDWEKKG